MSPAAQRWLEKGQESYRQERWEEAMKAFQEASRADPKHGDGPYWEGRTWGAMAFRASGRWQQLSDARRSRAAFEAALARDANHGPARFGLVRFFLEMPPLLGGSRREAEAQARDLEARQPLWGALAWAAIYEKSGDGEKAHEAYGQAAGFGPLEEEALLRWIWLLQRHQRFAEAFRVLEKHQPQATASAPILFEWGRTAAFSGQRLEEGRRALQRFLSLENRAPRRAEAYGHLGMIHRHEGRNDLAAQEFRHALKEDPSSVEARRNLEELETTKAP